MAKEGITWRLTGSMERYFARAQREFPNFARDSMRVLALRATGAVALENKVDTGRSRIAWTPIYRRDWGAGAEPRFEPVPPRGKSGRHSPAYVKRAQAEGRRGGRAIERHGRTSYSVSVVNAVGYVPFLDERSPFVRQAMRGAFLRWRRETQRDLREQFA